MSNYLTINYAGSEDFVRKQQEAGTDVRWDGWTMVFFRPQDAAIYSKDGAFRNGRIGYENRVDVDSDGTWKIDFRNIKRLKRS